MATYIQQMSRSVVIDELVGLIDDDGDLVFSRRGLETRENWELERLHESYFESVLTVRIIDSPDDYQLF